MRKFWISVALTAAWALAGPVALCNADCGCQAAVSCGCAQSAACECHGNDPCADPCACGGLFGRGRRGARYEGLNRSFNCGCNGSYKFPVPPLYTYHWPGMWQQPLMTDYHSPWRFPPLKPYVDEATPPAMGD